MIDTILYRMDEVLAIRKLLFHSGKVILNELFVKYSSSVWLGSLIFTIPAIVATKSSSFGMCEISFASGKLL